MNRLRNALLVLFGRVDLDREVARAKYFRGECFRARERVKDLENHRPELWAAGEEYKAFEKWRKVQSDEMGKATIADMLANPEKYLPPTEKSNDHR